MQALVGGWRELWQQGDFPFYYVQLPGWQTSNPDSPAGADGWARCREAQRRSLGIPNTGMAITLDLGDAKNIHPLNKQDVGLRLALLALNRTFKHDIVHSGPLYAGMAIEGHAIRIRFDHVGSGLMIGEKTGLDPVKELPDGQVKWVAIAGADMQWHWADMKIDGDTVLVSSEAVPDPVAVRYAYTAKSRRTAALQPRGPASLSVHDRGEMAVTNPCRKGNENLIVIQCRPRRVPIRPE